MFITQPKSLVSFLKASEQHLFRRAQVRQVLAYLRDEDFARYLQELCALLSDEGIRTHIKDLAFALLAEVTDPTESEWTIWEKWMTPALRAIEARIPNPDKLSALTWQRFFGSPSWFGFADQRGSIEDWLNSGSDGLANVIVNYLKVHHRHAPDRAAILLEPYANRRGKSPQRLSFFMAWAKLHTSRRLFDLFLRLVDNGTLDGPPTGNNSFWSMPHNLVENRPEWIPEVIAHQLRRRLAIIRTTNKRVGPTKLIGYDQSTAEMFHTSAERAPAAFVEYVLPIVLEISDSALIAEEPPKRDAVWLVLVKGNDLRGEDACLAGLAKALATLSCGGENMRDVIAELRSRETHVANHLLLALYRGGASRYADEAVALLCGEPWRFRCGFSDNLNWCAMELIRDVVPHSTVEDRKRLESSILGYVSPFERTVSGYRLAGASEFSLLSAIPTQLRSTRAKARFRELERKFGEPLGEPREMRAGMVRSPIEKMAADKMTDDHWLRAIVKYREENFVSVSKRALRGGAYQLAQVLEAKVKEEPDRFARLSLKFPADTTPLYLDRVLAALKNATIPDELKLRVCRKAFVDFRSHCGQSIADALGSMEEPLPEDAIEMLHYLATEHEDPDREAWQEDAGGGQPYSGGDIHTNGISTTRGRAVEAIQKLIYDDATYIDRFHATLGQMICDTSAAVLSCVADALRAVARHNPALALSLFQRAKISDDRLLATRPVSSFIHAGLRDNFLELRPTVERMLRSSEPEVCEAGARLAGVAALIHREASALADIALRGSSQHRCGIARVASANITVPECRAWSEAKLITLFNDEDPDVRRATASCFRRLEEETLDTYSDLIAAFCDSRAYQENSSRIFCTLEKTREKLPGTTCLACERFLDLFADDDKDLETSRYAGAYNVAKLIFRTYQQHQNDEWTPRVLDLIDRLCLERIFDARREFEQFER